MTAVSFGDPSFNEENASIDFEVINLAAVIQNNISASYEVFDNRTNSTLFGGVIKAFKMAPMAAFPYPIRWGYKPLEPGSFTIVVKANVSGKEVRLNKPFVIANQAVERVLDKQAEVHTQIKPQKSNPVTSAFRTISAMAQNSPVWFWMIIPLAIVAALLLLVSRKVFKKKSRVPRYRATSYLEVAVGAEQPKIRR